MNRRSPLLRRQLALVVSVGTLCVVPRPARADVASWMFLGAGWSRVGGELDPGVGADHTALLVNAGFGTTPAGAVVVGGVLHAGAYLGYGSDWGGALRVTTGGYSRGSWGLGLDVGPQYRFGDQPGPVGSARLLLGGPWGVSASVGASYGPDEVGTFMAVVGIDFARLTVHRTTGLDWFPNPHPSPRREDLAPSHQARAY